MRPACRRSSVSNASSTLSRTCHLLARSDTWERHEAYREISYARTYLPCSEGVRRERQAVMTVGVVRVGVRVMLAERVVGRGGGGEEGCR